MKLYTLFRTDSHEVIYPVIGHNSGVLGSTSFSQPRASLPIFGALVTEP